MFCGPGEIRGRGTDHRIVRMLSGVRIRVVWVAIAGALCASVLAAQTLAQNASPSRAGSKRRSAGAEPALWNARRQGEFVISLCTDLQGRLWVGTEDRGLWMWDPRKANPHVEPQSHQDTKSKVGRVKRSGPTSGRPQGGAATNANPAPPKSIFDFGRDDLNEPSSRQGAKDGGSGAPERVNHAPAPNRSARAEPTPGSLPGWIHFTRANTGGPPEPLGPVLSTGTPAEFALGDDDIYALACDKLGRIWVGNLNHGVSVYDGRPPELDERGHFKGWRNYDVLSGPLGERVFAIKTCPVDGDVWIATSAGLTRYRIDSDTWSYYTRGTSGGGLPSDQIQALAFLPDGTLIAGTQCDGLALCTPWRKPVGSAPAERSSGPQRDRCSARAEPTRDTLEYTTWRHVTTPNNTDNIPLVPEGYGLPSNLINDILVTHNPSGGDTIWVATTTGLARSTDRGESWRFIRGQDWLAKDKGLYHPPTPQQLAAAQRLEPRPPQTLLFEDYCTCLAQDPRNGNIWIGHRQKGVEIFNPRIPGRIDQSTLSLPGGRERAGVRVGASSQSEIRNLATAGRLGRPRSEILPTDYVFSILTTPGPDAACFIGYYGGGLLRIPLSVFASNSAEQPARARSKIEHQQSTISFALPPLPSPAKPPVAQELRDMAENLKAYHPGANFGGPLAVVLPDDWRTQGDWVGRYGFEYAVLCAMNAPLDRIHGRIPAFSVSATIGPHHAPDDGIRRWVHWIRTSLVRSLYSPDVGYRRQSEFDDHGEGYPLTFAGPDLLIGIHCPDGFHRVSLYFVNKDGHGGANRLRDYLITVEPASPGPPGAPCRARVRDFWGGVYKTFVIEGPGDWIFQIAKHGSLNTIVSGVFIDRICAPPTRFDHRVGYYPNSLLQLSPGRNLESPETHLIAPPPFMAGNAFARRARLRAWLVATRDRILAVRRVEAVQADSPAAAYARRAAALWTSSEREQFRTTMESAFRWHQSLTAQRDELAQRVLHQRKKP